VRLPEQALDDLVAGQRIETTILISSHELSEIDGLATDVAFMDRGRLDFQSTTEALLARFRQVSATFQTAPSTVTGLAPDWLTPTLFQRTLKFADRDFTGEASLRGDLVQHFGPIEQLDVRPMTLRDISKVLMLAGRRGAAR
jgi:ABC-2 type transport system ATP-binding protein